jgi:hypothetical protein
MANAAVGVTTVSHKSGGFSIVAENPDDAQTLSNLAAAAGLKLQGKKGEPVTQAVEAALDVWKQYDSQKGRFGPD